MLGIDLAVGDDQDVGTGTHRIFGIGGQRSEPGFDSIAAPDQRIADIQFERTELVRRVFPDIAQFLHTVERQHRLRYFETDRRIDVVRIQKIWLGPDEGHQRHDQLLTYRVDRRIGHLREKLLEVVVESLVPVGQHRQGGVRAHRAGRFLAVVDHRLEDDLDVFLGVAEGLLAIKHGSNRYLNLFSRCRQVVELYADFFNPLAIGLGVGQRVLEFLVVDDAPLFHIDQEHLARLQTPLLDNFLFRNWQDAGFGSHDHHVVVGHQVAGRTQAVAVERRANLAPVGKRHRRRAVPRLHHRGVVFVEGAAVLVHQCVLFPGFGNQ